MSTRQLLDQYLQTQEAIIASHQWVAGDVYDRWGAAPSVAYVWNADKKMFGFQWPTGTPHVFTVEDVRSDDYRLVFDTGRQRIVLEPAATKDETSALTMLRKTLSESVREATRQQIADQIANADPNDYAEPRPDVRPYTVMLENRKLPIDGDDSYHLLGAWAAGPDADGTDRLSFWTVPGYTNQTSGILQIVAGATAPPLDVLQYWWETEGPYSGRVILESPVDAPSPLAAAHAAAVLELRRNGQTHLLD